MTTSSKTITTDQVLESAKYLNSKDLRSMQAKLTATGKELLKLAGTSSLNELLSNEEKATLRQAAQVVSIINDRIAHAKEKKQRDEKAREIRFKEREQTARKLANEVFSLPTDTAEQCLEVIRIALVLNQGGVLKDFYNVDEFAARLMDAAQRQTPRFRPRFPDTWEKSKYLRSEASNLVREIITDVSDAIADQYYQRDIKTNLDTLRAKVDELRPQVLKQQAETIQCWDDALSEAGVSND